MAYFSIPRSGLVGEYLFDGNANDTNDGTKATVTATNVTYVSDGSGYQKQIGSWNGSSSAAYCVLSAAPGANFHYWAKFKTSSSATMMILDCNNNSNGNNRSSIYIASGALHFYSHNGSSSSEAVSSLSTYADGVEHMVEWDRSGSNVNAFRVDGQTITTTGSIMSGTINSTYLNFGYYAVGGSTFFFSGTLAHRVWNRALTDQESLALWHEFNRKLGGGSDFGAVIPAHTSYMDFQGDAIDVSQSTAGTVTNASLTTDRLGLSNCAYSFTSNNCCIDHPTLSAAPSGSYTLHGWFKPAVAATSGDYNIMWRWSTGNAGEEPMYLYYGGYQNNGYRIDVQNTGGTHFASTFSKTFSSGQWYHVAVTVGGGNAKIYFDGVLDNTQTYTGTAYTRTTALAVGNRTYNKNEGWEGSIGSSGLIPAELTASQVAMLYSIESQKKPYAFRRSIPSSLSNGLLFRCGAFNGSTMYDESGNGRNFTGTATKVRAGQLDAGSFSSQLLTLTRSAALENANGSAAIWFKNSGGASAQVLLETNNTVNTDTNGICSFIASGTVYSEVCSASTYYRVTAPGTWSDGKWHRLLWTWDGSNVKQYIDGALMGTTAQSTAVAYNSQDFKIGGDSSNGTRYLSGSLAYPTLWNRALNSYEVMMDRYSTYIQ